MNNRIKLCEAMGWTRIQRDPNYPTHEGVPPGKNKNHISDLPDPFTDANDCEALIRWLANGEKRNSLSYVVQIEIAMKGVNDGVQMWIFGRARSSVIEWKGDDWKQGVCELACRVIDHVYK